MGRWGVVVVGAIAGMAGIGHLPEGWVHDYFSGPAAHGAAWLLGVPVGDGSTSEKMFWRLPHPVLDLHVGRECAGLNFFLVAMLVLMVRARWSVGAVLWIPAAAYVGTIVANSVRLAAVFHARLVAEWLLPPQFFSMVHLLAGGCVFFAMLVLMHVFHEYVQQRFLQRPGATA